VKILANPNLPQNRRLYEPFTLITSTCTPHPNEGATGGAARSLITGDAWEKIEWGPKKNWEEILGGEFAKRSKTRISSTCKKTFAAASKTRS